MKKIDGHEGYETLILVKVKKIMANVEFSLKFQGGDQGEGRSKPNYVLGFGPLPPGRPSCDGNGFAGTTKATMIPHEVLKLFIFALTNFEKDPRP